MTLNKKALVIFGIAAVLLAAGLAYSITTSSPAETPSPVVATTTPEVPEQTASTTEPITDTTSKDSAPDFVCNKGVPDPSPDIDSPSTREAVAKTIGIRYHLLLNAPIGCIRTYMNAATDSEEEHAQIAALSDDELMQIAKGIPLMFDQPDRTRMNHPNTEWEMRGPTLVITEMVNGSSRGHWSAQFNDGMWW